MVSSDREWTLRQAQAAVDGWILQYGVRYFSELTNLAQLVEEVGEVARVMSRTYGDQSWKPAEVPSELGDELADVLFVLLCIAKAPDMRVRDIAREVGITERAVQRILSDLQEAGVVVRERVGRRNHYVIRGDAPLRHPLEAHRCVADLIRLTS